MLIGPLCDLSLSPQNGSWNTCWSIKTFSLGLDGVVFEYENRFSHLANLRDKGNNLERRTGQTEPMRNAEQASDSQIPSKLFQCFRCPPSPTKDKARTSKSDCFALLSSFSRSLGSFPEAQEALSTSSCLTGTALIPEPSFNLLNVL